MTRRRPSRSLSGCTARPDDSQISPALLLDLATACRRGERTQLTYRDGAGTTSTRRVDPYRLLAYDLTRQDWRTFRTDRIIDATATGQATAMPDPPDPAHTVSAGVALRPYPVRVTIRLAVPADEARRLVPPTVGVHRPDGDDATIIDIGGPDADGLARYLLSLGRPLQILHPEEVRQAFLTRTRQLLKDNQ
ncbi:WYL domain-containing protein [Microbispora oryzae]|uniref:WYL domain-containing protein n=1 Tax=Microbispora oryzae TaxID=2806554 RepID=UPI001E5479E1|nr:WYL domain-containing protein [Microbispora oryzae]